MISTLVAHSLEGRDPDQGTTYTKPEEGGVFLVYRTTEQMSHLSRHCFEGYDRQLPPPVTFPGQIFVWTGEFLRTNCYAAFRLEHAAR